MIKEGEILAEGTIDALVDEIKKYVSSHGGEPYTEGEGINIENNVISVDTNVLAKKSDIPTVTDTYSSTSSDAMSGKAVASAISAESPYLIKTRGHAGATITDTNKWLCIATMEVPTSVTGTMSWTGIYSVVCRATHLEKLNGLLVYSLRVTSYKNVSHISLSSDNKDFVGMFKITYNNSDSKFRLYIKEDEEWVGYNLKELHVYNDHFIPIPENEQTFTSEPTKPSSGMIGTSICYVQTDHMTNLFSNSNRPSSANIQKGDGNLYQFKATSNMSIGKPNHDGHMLHFSWDFNNGYDSQLFIPNGDIANNGCHPAIRGMSEGRWGDWRYLAFVSDLNDYTKKSDEVVWHCLEVSAAGSYPNIIVGDGKKHIIVGPGLGSDSYSTLTISIRGILAGHKHGDDASFYYIPSYRQNIQFGSTDGSVRQNFIFTQEQRNNLYKIPATYRITETYSGIYVGTEAELITENYITKW